MTQVWIGSDLSLASKIDGRAAVALRSLSECAIPRPKVAISPKNRQWHGIRRLRVGLPARRFPHFSHLALAQDCNR